MGSLFRCKSHLSLFNDIPPHEPPFKGSSSPIPGIRIWPIISFLFVFYFSCYVHAV